MMTLSLRSRFQGLALLAVTLRIGAILAALTGLVALGTGTGRAAGAEYRLAVGDVIEISVAGMPDLRQSAAINVEGQVRFPLLGALKAAGLTIDELQATVREQMPKKTLRQRALGQEYIIVLDPQEIILRVVEYRPVYVLGDIARPGELAFRPGMTVRQAIALGGGVGSARGTGTDPLFMTRDLRAQYQSLMSEVAVERTRVARIEGEIRADAPSFEGLLSDLQLPESTRQQILSNEKELHRARQTELERESVYLQSENKRAGERLVILKKQQVQEEEGLSLDTADWERVRGLFEKGMVPVTRLSDTRRSVLLSSTRALQTNAEVMLVERIQEEVRRKQEKLHQERRSQLLAELQQANTQLAGLEAKLKAAREKLALIGDTSPMLRELDQELEIKIFRKGSSNEERIAADASTPLAPGDVVEVSLPFESHTSQLVR
jgi:polysaccharide export outer membrane protein